MLPNDNILLRVGFLLYCSYYADEFESHGGSFGAGAEITECVEPPPDNELLPIITKYANKLNAAWPRGIDGTLEAMGVGEDEELIIDVLYYTLMPCIGHGVSLRDNHQVLLDTYQDATGEELDQSPFYAEMDELRDLAWFHLETPNPEFAVYDTVNDELIEGRFWTEEFAEGWIEDHRECFPTMQMEVFELEPA